MAKRKQNLTDLFGQRMLTDRGRGFAFHRRYQQCKLRHLSPQFRNDALSGRGTDPRQGLQCRDVLFFDRASHIGNRPD